MGKLAGMHNDWLISLNFDSIGILFQNLYNRLQADLKTSLILSHEVVYTNRN